ncbi:hypothetical protein KR054_009452 [Drosophila jambulina]|nr:hypothetical protein KR054_009452 [Drosophila jambulina]
MLLLFSMLKMFWHTFMTYFGLLMELAEESRFVMLLISCTMALALILNVQSGQILFHELKRSLITRRINSRLDQYPSPVHIASGLACRRQLKHPLLWSHYNDLPLAMILENNGSTVILRSCYPPSSVPHLSGGELGGQYHFVEATFKWGVMRSEHSIDGQHFPLEMQVLHSCPQRKDYLALSYVFLRTRYNNVPFKQITGNLRCIRWPESSIELPPFELGTLMRSFDRGYYSYQGTYDNGETELPVTWLIDPQPSTVHYQQTVEFAALCGKDGATIKSNARMERSLGRRSVQFYY